MLGFVFTFVIGALWGHQFYQPEHFWSTEPFLAFFLLLYVAVPVLFARRQPTNLRGYVDGSLVFGVPLVAFALQHALVRDTEYGLAISAVVVGLFYAALATTLWQRERAGLLAEAFVALAVVFGTLAIPLAVDGRWTGAAWAIEGAALVWIGARQGRPLARYAGLLLQVAAGVAFLAAHGLPAGGLPVLNALYLGALMVNSYEPYHALTKAYAASSARSGWVSPTEGASDWRQYLQEQRTRPGLLTWNGLYDAFVLAYKHSINPVHAVVDDGMVLFWELFSEVDKSLADATSFLTREPYYKAERKSKVDEEFWAYNGKDTCVTFECIDNLLQREEMDACALQHYWFNMSLLPPILYMELRGMRFNDAARRALLECPRLIRCGWCRWNPHRLRL